MQVIGVGFDLHILEKVPYTLKTTKYSFENDFKTCNLYLKDIQYIYS